MEIRIGSLYRGAQEARGTVVIIDVFRAFTTDAVAFSKGAEKIVLVAEVEEALKLREQGVGEICMGEVDGIRPDGFDLGNSPYEMLDADVAGKSLIQSTRAGTVGMSAAVNASQIYAGSLVLAASTVKAVLDDAPDLVTIVAMGVEARVHADEDEQCAFYMRNLLQGGSPITTRCARWFWRAQKRRSTLILSSRSFTLKTGIWRFKSTAWTSL